MGLIATVEEIVAMGKSTNVPLPYNFAPRVGEAEWGPNCWNTTMVWHEPYEPMQCTDPHTMEVWMANSTIEISESELRYGDIAVLRLYGELVHTAIYLEPDTFFHKIGFAGPWLVQSMEGLNQVYFGDYNEITWRRYVGVQEKAA